MSQLLGRGQHVLLQAVLEPHDGELGLPDAALKEPGVRGPATPTPSLTETSRIPPRAHIALTARKLGTKGVSAISEDLAVHGHGLNPERRFAIATG